jgi:hypothetical protein
MANELLLDLAAGVTVHMRAVRNVLDVTVFESRGLHQRIVHGALVGADDARIDGHTLVLGSTTLPVSTDEGVAVMAFVALAKVPA